MGIFLTSLLAAVLLAFAPAAAGAIGLTASSSASAQIKTTTGGSPTQTVTCDAISANYHRPLINGDHINATITPPGAQVNVYVILNVTGGASYNGQNGFGLQWNSIDGNQTSIPLTVEQIESGVISLPYASHLTQASWTVSQVQTNETESWPNVICDTTPKDAVATVAIDQQASCTSNSTVKVTLLHATWGGATLDFTPGDHKPVAFADQGHLFPNGESTLEVPYPITAADKSLCPEVVVPSNPSYSITSACGTITGTFTNVIALKEGEVGTNAEYTMTDKDGKSQPVTVPPNETVSVTVTFAEDTGLKVVVIGTKGGQTAEYFVPTDCVYTPPVLTPEQFFPHDTCGISDDGVSLPGTLLSPGHSVTEDGTYDVVEIDGQTWTFTFTPFDKRATIAEPGKGDTYTLIGGVATWKYTFDTTPCKPTEPIPPTEEPTPPTSTPTPPPTDTPVPPTTEPTPPTVEPTPTPEPTTPPTAEPTPVPVPSNLPPTGGQVTPPTTPTKTVHVPVTVKAVVPAKELAETGTDTAPWLIAGALSFVLGIGLVVMHVRTKRRTAKG